MMIDKNTKGFIGFSLIVLISFGGHYLLNLRNQNLLDNGIYNWAIVTSVERSAKMGPSIALLHKVNDIEISTGGVRVSGDCKAKLNFGDTVFIKYAIDDPTLVQVLTCYWNREKQFEKIGKLTKR